MPAPRARVARAPDGARQQEEQRMITRISWTGRRFSRRTFLKGAGGGAAALALAASGGLVLPVGAATTARFGNLVADPTRVLDLPPGFKYRIISAEGLKLSNGAPVPSDFDGMAAFPGPGGSVYLVRNHELRAESSGDKIAPPVEGRNPYMRGAIGGTTGILLGPDGKKVREYVTNAGTVNNCAGGPTPWNTWLTCEEDRSTNHGYVFEVDPADPENDLSKTPIRAMGFFSHEAAAIDPQTGIVYLTEDDFRGKIPESPTQENPQILNPENPDYNQISRASFLYRFVPNDTSRRPGALQQGGKLQVAKLDERPLYNADLAEPGDRFAVRWVDVNPDDAHGDALAKGGIAFNRLERADFAGGAFCFDDTAGGEKRLGQVYRYLPATNTLELFYEGTDENDMESPDNIVVAPWGDLIFAEDGEGENRIMGITPGGQVYKFGVHHLENKEGDTGEFAGPTFSPDGRTFFVNIQEPGVTFAITGPFPAPSAAARRAMAFAAPPAHLAPTMSGELLEAAERYGISPLTAAAYARHGVPLA